MWIGHDWSQCGKGTPAKSSQYAPRHCPSESEGLFLSTTHYRFFQLAPACLMGTDRADALSPHEFRIDYFRMYLVQVCEPPAFAGEH
jgi:hypothetical protein